MSSESDDAFVQGSRYAREFNAAWDRSLQLGLPMPSVRLVLRKHCLNMQIVETLLQDYFSRYTVEEVRGQAFAINCALRASLSERLRTPLTLTIGWIEMDGKPCFRHDEPQLREWLQVGRAGGNTLALSAHVWLTSPAFEILDVTLPTTFATEIGGQQLVGGIIYLPNEGADTGITYHPTVLGEAFLDQIGATRRLGA